MVTLARAAAVTGQNQQWLFVVFDELVMPAGYAVNYENAFVSSGIPEAGGMDGTLADFASSPL